MKLFLLVLSLLVFQGCSFSTQVALLNPEVPIAKSNSGNGKTISLQVIDERPEKELGHRGSAYGDAAKISSAQNISELLFEKISQGLKANGFKVERGNNAAIRSLRAEIRQIWYKSTNGFVTFTIKANSAIKGVCTNRGKSYENMYRGEVEEDWMVVPFAETNEKLLNQSLSKTLENMFLDKNLQDCLSS